MNASKPHALDERLAELPREVAPPRDLWPSIAADLARDRRRPQGRAGWLAAAAGVAGACIAAAATWAVMHRHGATPELAQAAALGEISDARYLSARAELEVSFRAQIAMLDPKTRAQIEQSLGVIRQAHEDIRKALAADPSSPVLAQLWQSTWHDEIDLYDRVIRGTQTLTRT